ncbi:hypothetical protein [Parapedobacter soli]|uniref:hypothetical protein n=1 Tax=Parapedobacter soli TaxID=416955 RepID=UPI0021C991C4|nr:hypothetical protein [Parapedobacter soli]
MMKTKTHTPTPATTPAMIQAYWLKLFHGQACHEEAIYWHGFGDRIYADTYASPFVIRLYHSNPCDPRVAYLSAVHGIVEWRFGIKTLGYANCSVVTDPEQIIWLDSLFWQYIITEEQGKTIGRPSTIRRVVEHHIRTGVKPIANRIREYNEQFG